jgi:hypothetical protein
MKNKIRLEYCLRVSASALTILLCAVFCSAQKPSMAKPTAPRASAVVQNPVNASAAYAEVLLRKTEVEADLEDLLVEHTEEYPKVKESRYEFSLLQNELQKLQTVKPADASKLSLALGKLIVRKVSLEVDLWSMRLQYTDDYEDVKRVKRKIAVFEKAIVDILR